MAKFEASVVIDRPAGEVWTFIADLSNLSRTTPNAPSLRQTSQGAFGLGSTFSGEDGRRRLTVRVTEFIPNRKMAAVFLEPWFLMGTTDIYDLETVDGRTRLTEMWDTRLTGLFRLLGPFFASRTRRDVTTRLDNMKRFLESGQRP